MGSITGMTNHRHVLLLLLVGLYASAHLTAAGPAARDAAFIGYSETAATCRDSLPDCEESSSLNKCLLDPYAMRSLCPISCGVERCVQPGTALRNFAMGGYATAAGTRAYSSSQHQGTANGHFSLVPWPPAGQQVESLTLSSLGLGTYLGPEDDKTDEDVVRAVLYGTLRGWNVIDTAANYRGGRAEKAIGTALQVLLSGKFSQDFKQGRAEVTRDALFIATKAGFLAPDVKEDLQEAGNLTAGDVVGGWHCMTASCIRASVKSSLHKLRLQTLDLVYLHNAAEMQLQHLGRAGFLKALRAAFSELEQLRAQGLLRGYGLATWDCFRRPQGHPQHLNLQDMIDVARQVGGEHHGFAAVQLPININMQEAHKHPWQVLRLKQYPLPLEFQNIPPAAANSTAVQAPANTPDSPAASPPPPPPPPPVTHNVTLLQAARTLKLAVFASGPLAEGSLLQALPPSLDGITAIATLPSPGTKLLQLVRSTPDVACTLVGHKQQHHVTSNVALAAEPRMGPKVWELVNKRVSTAVHTVSKQA